MESKGDELYGFQEVSYITKAFKRFFVWTWKGYQVNDKQISTYRLFRWENWTHLY